MERQALTELMERVRPRLVRVAAQYVDDAEDVVQNVLASVWGKRESIRAEQATQYINRALGNRLKNAYRDGERREDVVTHWPEDEEGEQYPLLDPNADPEAAVYARIEGEQVVSVIENRIDDPYRTALLLFAVEDLPYTEIAERMGVAVGTAKSRVARARNRLREQLSE